MIVETPYRKSVIHHHHHHHQTRSPTSDRPSSTTAASTTTSIPKRNPLTQLEQNQHQPQPAFFFRQALASLLINTKNDVALKKWMSELERETMPCERRSLPLELKNRNFVPNDTTTLPSYKPPVPISTRPSRRNDQDLAAVVEMRSRLFALVDSHLTSMILSPLKLADFRLALVDRLRATENDAIEQFVLTVFEFFSANFFFKLLGSVKIEWSYRLKSYVIENLLLIHS